MNPTMNFEHLVELCRLTHEAMQRQAARSVDLTLVIRNWFFGRYIVEFEQNGADRAEYGPRILSTLAASLKPHGIKGTGPTNLKLCRQFYLAYGKIGQTPSNPSDSLLGIGQTLSDQLPPDVITSSIQPTPSAELAVPFIPVTSASATPSLSAPKVRPNSAQGNALGSHAKKIQALKGRPMNGSCAIKTAHGYAALSGLVSSLSVRPRALPWATIACPLGAQKVQPAWMNRQSDWMECP